MLESMIVSIQEHHLHLMNNVVFRLVKLFLIVHVQYQIIDLYVHYVLDHDNKLQLLMVHDENEIIIVQDEQQN